MNRDWTDFKSLHSNIAGARVAFENACEKLFRKIYADRPVSQVEVKQGDGGIDIFIGELGVEPITVIQCKFFLETFEDSQKNQIRSSFKTAINASKYELKEWILCIPRVIDIDEHSWWFGWKKKKTEEHNRESSFISIKNGNELIDLFKVHNLYNQVFEIEDSTKIDEIHKAVVTKPIILPEMSSPQIVLFNNYSRKCEPYYLERQIDKDFVNSLKLNNLWLFGNSGVGKTTLINRNLLVNNLEYCSCDLSPVDIKSSADVLEEILFSIEEKFNLKREIKANKIKQVAQILCKVGKKIVITIDELSVKEDCVLKEIADDLVKLVTHLSNSATELEELKFVVSTISTPKEIIGNKSKASEHFQYLNCNNWSDEIENLFELLSKALKLNLAEYKVKILKESNNSSRILKSIFRKIVASDDLRSASIEQSIALVKSELVN